MTVLRRPLAAMLLVLTVLMVSRSAFARTGMFLIHGKGAKDLRDIQVARDYWGYDMINRITNYQTIPYAIGHYDGNKDPWLAARAIGAQLAEFIETQGITNLVVVTHSYGATVFRVIASWPFQYIYQPAPGDPPLEQWRLDVTNQRLLILRRLRVAWLIAGPNGGSEAADLAYLSSGFRRSLMGFAAYLLGQRNLATQFCTTRVMAIINHSHLHGTPGRPALPRRWHPIVGVSAFSDGSRAADYLLVGLAAISNMPTPNDGMVAAWSAGLVGRPLYLGSCGGTCNPTYFEFTNANHDHSHRYETKPGYIDHNIAEYIAYLTFHGDFR